MGDPGLTRREGEWVHLREKQSEVRNIRKEARCDDDEDMDGKPGSLSLVCKGIQQSSLVSILAESARLVMCRFQTKNSSFHRTI